MECFGDFDSEIVLDVKYLLISDIYAHNLLFQFAVHYYIYVNIIIRLYLSKKSIVKIPHIHCNSLFEHIKKVQILRTIFEF